MLQWSGSEQPTSEGSTVVPGTNSAVAFPAPSLVLWPTPLAFAASKPDAKPKPPLSPKPPKP